MATWVNVYCVKCRKKVGLVKPKVVILKQGRSKVRMKSWAGRCPICGTKVFRFISGV